MSSLPSVSAGVTTRTVNVTNVFNITTTYLHHVLHCRERQSVVIPLSSLPSIPAGVITLIVNVTNVFNVTSTSTLNFTKRPSENFTPAFELARSPSQFFPSAGFRIAAKPLPGNCSAAKTREVWEWSSSIPGLDLSGVQGTSLSLSGRELLGKVEVGKVSNASPTVWFLLKLPAWLLVMQV
jgi:hypothetical protein